MAYQYYSNPYNNYNNYNAIPNQYGYQQPSFYQPQYSQQIPINQIQSQPLQQIQSLNGQVVDSIEVVKAKDVDLSGNPVFYPNVNGNEIYKKQLMTDGTSRIVTYKIVEPETEKKEDEIKHSDNSISIEQLNKSIGELKTDIISEIKKIFG